MGGPILGAREITRRRFAAGSRGADGRWTAGTTTDTKIRASVQPLTEKDLRNLPEGERSVYQRKLYTKADLRTLDNRTTPPTPADQVVIDGEVFEVKQTKTYDAVLPHTWARVVRLDEGVA